MSLLDWEHEMLALQTTDLEAEWMGAQRICKLGEQPFAWQYEENRTRNLGDQQSSVGFLGSDAGQERSGTSVGI